MLRLQGEEECTNSLGARHLKRWLTEGWWTGREVAQEEKISGTRFTDAFAGDVQSRVSVDSFRTYEGVTRATEPDITHDNARDHWLLSCEFNLTTLSTVVDWRRVLTGQRHEAGDSITPRVLTVTGSGAVPA
jgi:hypothetical protein